MKLLTTLVLRALLAAIRCYQRTLSPDHGWLRPLFPQGVCRFTPTCSEYAALALQRHGGAAVPLIVRRLLRCHPFHSGGVDPVPEQRA